MLRCQRDQLSEQCALRSSASRAAGPDLAPLRQDGTQCAQGCVANLWSGLCMVVVVQHSHGDVDVWLCLCMFVPVHLGVVELWFRSAADALGPLEALRTEARARVAESLPFDLEVLHAGPVGQEFHLAVMGPHVLRVALWHGRARRPSGVPPCSDAACRSH